VVESRRTLRTVIGDTMYRTVDLVVIGAGPGGYAAAFRAADLGHRVVLVEREPNPGGVCLLRGCIPSKALLSVARLLEELRRAAEKGIELAQPPTVNLARTQAWKKELVARMSRGIRELARARRVELLRGTARFLDSRTVEVRQDGEAAPVRLRFRKAVIATGARPAFPPGLAPDGEVILSSDHVLDLATVPPTALIIGGGYIGLEMGRFLAACGSQVTIVEVLDRLLPGTDPELVRPVQRALSRIGVRILTSHRVEELHVQDGLAHATLLNQRDGSAQTAQFHLVLVATGRVPATEGLGLAEGGITIDRQGAIVTNRCGQTSNPDVYAVGDCRGGIMLAHKARHEGLVVADALSGKRASFNYAAVPQVVFTDPEIACVGWTEQDATRLGLASEVEVLRFPFAAIGRAAIQNSTDGLVKVIVERGTGRLLGVGIVGPEAGELIAEATLAVQSRATLEELRHAIHPHPTASEAIEEVAWLAAGGAVHLYKPPRTQPRRRTKRR